MVDRVKRGELARFLRSRRERLTPEAAGLPPGGRRRTNGLRREEVAVLAGVSPAWYASLEQGRSIHPSREVVDSIGNILQFSDDERVYVRTLLEEPDRHARDPASSTFYVDLIADVVAQYDDGPSPVYATDYRGDLIAWNQAATEWYYDWSLLEPPDQNLMRWLLTHPTARERLPEWENVVRDALARWRAEMARQPTTVLEQFIEELARESPDFRRWWEEHDVLEHRSGTRLLRHDKFGEQSMLIVPMFPPELRSCGIIFHVPTT